MLKNHLKRSFLFTAYTTALLFFGGNLLTGNEETLTINASNDPFLSSLKENTSIESLVIKQIQIRDDWNYAVGIADDVLATNLEELSNLKRLSDLTLISYCSDDRDANKKPRWYGALNQDQIDALGNVCNLEKLTINASLINRNGESVHCRSLDLSPLTTLPYLKQLELILQSKYWSSGFRLTEPIHRTQLATITQIPSLQRLLLHNITFENDINAEILGEFNQLFELVITEVSWTPENTTQFNFACLPNLQTLYFRPKPNQSDLKGVDLSKTTPNLKHLFVYDANFGNKEVSKLCKLDKLEIIQLHGPISNIRHFSKIPLLRVLTLQGPHIHDQDWSCLAKTKTLEVLFLHDCPLTRNDFISLQKLTQLKILNLMGVFHSTIREQDWEELQAALPDTKIWGR